ncbi:threonine-phosphate decarboxylase CobD [Ferviditalea candida]|uniref:threonine-phosphate decarboxylase n=1 Tax=Ferviditalea candida TaxID=3108399 RepID=A0ABU5ZHS9_9BACL|nr:threonine-phosphate decarboxylase CobD [Paenibacillaceae bacterium T2]
MLEKNGHGGDWATAMEMFPCILDKLLDYSANINPLGPPAALQQLLSQQWNFLTRYPDPEVRELRGAISAKYGIMPESVLVGNGAAEVIDLIVRTLKPETVGVIDPTFSEYREASEKYGANIVSIQALAEEEFSVPLEKVIEALAKVDALFIGQPNNPTGNRWERRYLEELIRSAEKFGTRIILDEAFIDFFPDEADVSMVHEAERSETVVVVRSMTKFYAIPGLRLGYAVAGPSLIRAMKRLQVPWSVNHLAQKAGVLALQDLVYERHSRQLISVERSWLSRELARLGCQTYESAANFLLVRLGNHCLDADELQRRLGFEGILIRCCTTFIGLNDHYFRVAVRTRTENERFIRALEAALKPAVIGSG